jgi:hypothetical protein
MASLSHSRAFREAAIPRRSQGVLTTNSPHLIVASESFLFVRWLLADERDELPVDRRSGVVSVFLGS